MSNNGTIYAGFDPGHSANKFARVQGGDITTYALPAMVGLTTHKQRDGLSLSGVVRSRKTGRQPFRVVFDGIEYLVGPNVDQFTKPSVRLDLDRFTDSPELRASFYAGAARLVNGGAHQLALAIALPVTVLEDKAEADRIERGIKKWLVGEHVFSVDGVETVLMVTRIRTRIPQPVATWFDWGMDTTGQWVKGKEAQLAPTLVVDEGFNTLDVLVIENGQIVDRVGGGDLLGMSRAAEELMALLRHRYGGELAELPQANELIKAVVNGDRAEVYVEGELTDVSREARSCLRSLEADVDNFMIRSLGKAKLATYRVLLTGGGALALAGRLLQRFPTATVMPEPVLANARGLAKLAGRPGFLS
jgi:hypothetical protein